MQDIIDDGSRPLNALTVNSMQTAPKILSRRSLNLLYVVAKQCSRSQFTGFLVRHKQVILLSEITININHFNCESI